MLYASSCSANPTHKTLQSISGNNQHVKAPFDLRFQSSADHHASNPHLFFGFAMGSLGDLSNDRFFFGKNAGGGLRPAVAALFLRGIYPTNSHEKVYMGLIIKGTIPKVPPFPL